MATDDIQRLVTGTASAPASFTIPGNGQIRPKAIFAHYDGSGAASSFVPALKVVSDGGQTVGIYSDVNNLVAAGGSADSSWFPFVGNNNTTVIGPGSGCVYYVGPPTGNASVDTVMIQTAHDALPANGGIAQLCRGTYALTGDPALTFSKPIQLAGHGRVANRSGATSGFSQNAPTVLTYGSTTGTAISCTTTDSFVLRDFALVNTAVASPPTAGAGITVTGVLCSGFEFVNLSVVGFFRCIDVQQGSEWVMHRCYIGDFVQDGLRIQNLTNADFGDMGILGNFFYRGPHNLGGNNGIHWLSSGGMRCQSNKFNIMGTPGADNSIGIYIDPTAGITTSDLLIEGNSLENYEFGIAFAFTPGAGSTVGNIVIAANQTLGWTGGIDLQSNVAGHWSRISVAGNVMDSRAGGGGTGLLMQQVDNITYGPNVYSAGLTNKFLNNGGVTNALQIGNG